MPGNGQKLAFALNENLLQSRTVWKFHDFSITQILREINFVDSRSAKSAILTHLEALNFDIYQFLHLFKAVIYQLAKMAVFALVETTKLISRKI